MRRPSSARSSRVYRRLLSKASSCRAIGDLAYLAYRRTFKVWKNNRQADKNRQEKGRIRIARRHARPYSLRVPGLERHHEGRFSYGKHCK
jgi:hypothetical protein